VGLCNQAWVNYGQGGPVTASACVTINGNTTVRIGVYNEAGELVKTILVAQYSQALNNIQITPNAITALHGYSNIYFQGNLLGSWDGTNAHGDPVSNGIYYIKVDNIDSFGVVTSVTQQVTVSRALYQVALLIYNEAGEVVRHLYSYVDNPGMAEVTGISLSSAVFKPALAGAGNTPNQVVISMSNATTVIWDGKSDSGGYVTAGKYFIGVSTVDGQGSNSTVFGAVMVQSADSLSGQGKVTARPNVLTLASGKTSMVFQSDSTESLTLKASIYTVAGELVATVEGSPGTNQSSWDAGGAASGIYLVVVEIRNTQGGVKGRQVVKVLVVH